MGIRPPVPEKKIFEGFLPYTGLKVAFDEKVEKSRNNFKKKVGKKVGI